jgi:hypothetical protein
MACIGFDMCLAMWSYCRTLQIDYILDSRFEQNICVFFSGLFVVVVTYSDTFIHQENHSLINPYISGVWTGEDVISLVHNWFFSQDSNAPPPFPHLALHMIHFLRFMGSSNNCCPILRSFSQLRSIAVEAWTNPYGIWSAVPSQYHKPHRIVMPYQTGPSLDDKCLTCASEVYRDCTSPHPAICGCSKLAFGSATSNKPCSVDGIHDIAVCVMAPYRIRLCHAQNRHQPYRRHVQREIVR